jgi:hypothetical protein
MINNEHVGLEVTSWTCIQEAFSLNLNQDIPSIALCGFPQYFEANAVIELSDGPRSLPLKSFLAKLVILWSDALHIYIYSVESVVKCLCLFLLLPLSVRDICETLRFTSVS